MVRLVANNVLDIIFLELLNGFVVIAVGPVKPELLVHIPGVYAGGINCVCILPGLGGGLSRVLQNGHEAVRLGNCQVDIV